MQLGDPGVAGCKVLVSGYAAAVFWVLQKTVGIFFSAFSHQCLCLVDRAAGDAHFSGDFARRETPGQPVLNSLLINLGGAAAIDASAFGGGDAFGLALAPEIGLELGEDTEHVEEGLARGGRRVHWLLGCGQVGTLVLQHRDDRLQVTHRAGQV